MGAVGNSSHKEMGTSEENKKSLTERDPDGLLADYKKLLVEVAIARDALRGELAKALESVK